METNTVIKKKHVVLIQKYNLMADSLQFKHNLINSTGMKGGGGVLTSGAL